MVRERCIATNRHGDPCKAFALPGQTVCWSHHPDNVAAVKDAQRRGGANRSTARRAAKMFAAIGKQMKPHELPDVLRGCILRVASGQMEPNQARAIADLARASVTLSNDLELPAKIEELERAIADVTGPGQVRRVA